MLEPAAAAFGCKEANFPYEFTHSAHVFTYLEPAHRIARHETDLNAHPLGKTLGAPSGRWLSNVNNGVLLMIKLGKVSIETRGDKSAPWAEISQEPEIFI